MVRTLLRSVMFSLIPAETVSVTDIRQNDAIFVNLRGEIWSASLFSQKRQQSSLPPGQQSVPHNYRDGQDDDEHHGDQVDQPVVELRVRRSPGVRRLVERNFR